MSDDIQFTLFQKLPPELQVMVWEFAASVPRVLKVTSEKLHPAERGRFIANYTINSPHQIPPILQTTSSFRQVSLKFYIPAFSLNLGHPVYFNFACDVLHHTSSLMAGHCSDISNGFNEFGYDVKKEVKHDAKRVENLMVEKDYLSPVYTLRICAGMFPRLKTVVLEFEGEFHSNFRLDDVVHKYTFDQWTRDTEKELMEEWAAMGETGVAKFTYMTAEEMSELIEIV